MAERLHETGDGNRPSAAQIADNFSDLHPPLGAAKSDVEANRCLYCYDAPCVRACPTGIDIPRFIHQIRTGNLDGSARTILSANILGGTCARACPTEVLCEQACVLNAGEDAPIAIGALQRHAVDHLLAKGGAHPFARAADSGKHVAVVGAGPAGLAFAHRAAMLGHAVTVFDAKPKPGGLNEYGLAAYKMTDDFAQREVEFLLGIGGIQMRYGQRLGEQLQLAQLRAEFDAVFLATGLGGSNALGVPGEDLPGVRDAIDFIEELRQAPDKSQLAIGDEVVVIGGGNTAIDAAVQARRLGARRVTLAYRRGGEQMGATAWEQDLARSNGVIIELWAKPVALEGEGHVAAVVFERTQMRDGKLVGNGDTFRVAADRVFKAIGQHLLTDALAGLNMVHGKINVDAQLRSSLDGVYAGGDCIVSGLDLTVQAVEDGKRAAINADAWLRGKAQE
ncbi:MAG: NAD(P)-dependent oxidoreductase [Xanthomonadaceae bacterium]|nr:NAD(P)-dependent oxidoreductase [Xanthomonadaceae bacterium]MDP2185598.1 NAD(P)-dependent oxidoreductase [Xanthomonadales bacterium]MDZ4115510.1 NAD(P)-dependent oxidoreductase [Xanthomonadaceae bacterium]MDZ4378255.1 NAD(P)-dependent oxidoreductase [Xanthomonadaceae bacterium]